MILYIYCQDCFPKSENCTEIIAGTCFRGSVSPFESLPIVIEKSCSSLQNFTSISQDIEGIASVYCKENYQISQNDLDLCDCRNSNVTRSVYNIQDMPDVGSAAALAYELRKLHASIFQFIDHLPLLGFSLKINMSQLAVGLQAASDKLTSVSDEDPRKLLAFSLWIVVAIESLVCCQTGELANNAVCPDSLGNENVDEKFVLTIFYFEACQPKIEHLILWPRTTPGSSIQLSKCSQYYGLDKVKGDLYRWCQSTLTNSSIWSPVSDCHCYSEIVSIVYERMITIKSKDYPPSYLIQMASFLHKNQGDVAGKQLTIDTLNLIYTIRQERNVTNYPLEYQNLDNCLLRTATDILQQLETTSTHCPIHEGQQVTLSNVFYQLTYNVFGEEATNSFLGTWENFTYQANMSKLISYELSWYQSGCTHVGIVVPLPPITIIITIPGMHDSYQDMVNPQPVGPGDLTVLVTGSDEQPSPFQPLPPPVIHVIQYNPIQINGSNETTIASNETIIVNSTVDPMFRVRLLHSRILSIISYIGLSLSAIGLIVTLLAFIILRLPKSRKWFIHVNLIIAIVFSNVGFMALINQTADKQEFPISELVSAYERCVLLQTNIIIFGITLYILTHRMSDGVKKASESNRKSLRTDIRNAIALLPLLGLCWIVGLFVPIPGDYVADYLFTISISMQGFVLFLFHCLLDKQVIAAIKRRNFRWRPARAQSRSQVQLCLNSYSQGNTLHCNSGKVQTDHTTTSFNKPCSVSSSGQSLRRKAPTRSCGGTIDQNCVDSISIESGKGSIECNNWPEDTESSSEKPSCKKISFPSCDGIFNPDCIDTLSTSPDSGQYQ
ncbi:Adhesion G protein-coupled receptor L3 [Trichoplax sp. H2]|nr:Adhesion G protein-coupled receptor L3 [Trichoplax sp. H2]|eukprot:RDD41429.1 Adhesion G protein-coupled receptor L3 [Trichoplax sp. H2]